MKREHLYNYVIIKENYPELERESVLLYNEYDSNKRFALLKTVKAYFSGILIIMLWEIEEC